MSAKMPPKGSPLFPPKLKFDSDATDCLVATVEISTKTKRVSLSPDPVLMLFYVASRERG